MALSRSRRISLVTLESLRRPRLKALLDHFGEIDDPRVPWQVAHPLPEVLLLAVCGTICDCDDYDLVAEWGEAHLSILRRYLPYHHGVPTGRWLTILLNRTDPHLLAQAFTDWVRATWPQQPDFMAIDGKTSRRSRDRATGKPPHCIWSRPSPRRRVWCSATRRCPIKASETAAIPILIVRLPENNGPKGALVPIDAIATNPSIAAAITVASGDYLLAVKAHQPTPRTEVESLFNTAVAEEIETITEHDKGYGRIEERRVGVVRQVDWLVGSRRFPGKTRLPGAASLMQVRARAELKDRCRTETRYYVTSTPLAAQRAADADAGAGPSRTACPGSSTSSSPTINHACERARAPAT